MAGLSHSQDGCLFEAQLQLIGLNAFNVFGSPPVALTNWQELTLSYTLTTKKMGGAISSKARNPELSRLRSILQYRKDQIGEYRQILPSP